MADCQIHQSAIWQHHSHEKGCLKRPLRFTPIGYYVGNLTDKSSSSISYNTVAVANVSLVC